jgi:hypothetical protein
VTLNPRRCEELFIAQNTIRDDNLCAALEDSIEELESRRRSALDPALEEQPLNAQIARLRAELEIARHGTNDPRLCDALTKAIKEMEVPEPTQPKVKSV